LRSQVNQADHFVDVAWVRTVARVAGDRPPRR
jgi:hypothetical protein